jgi:hypothetical protein
LGAVNVFSPLRKKANSVLQLHEFAIFATIVVPNNFEAGHGIMAPHFLKGCICGIIVYN